VVQWCTEGDIVGCGSVAYRGGYSRVWFSGVLRGVYRVWFRGVPKRVGRFDPPPPHPKF